MKKFIRTIIQLITAFCIVIPLGVSSVANIKGMLIIVGMLAIAFFNIVVLEVFGNVK